MNITESILPQILLIIVLIMINAFFAGSEMAIVSTNKTKLKLLIEDGNEKAKKLEKLMEEPSKLLSTIQIGITLAGFLASASAAVGLSELLARFLNILKIPYSNQISIVIVTIILSYISLVFGELIPKKLALLNPEKVALANIDIIMVVYKVFIPFIKILSFSTNFILKVFKLNTNQNLETVSKEEVMLILEGSSIKEPEKEMIEKIMDFEEKLAREIMIPRTSMFALNIDTKISELFSYKEIIRYSRIPIYSEDLDNIVGILHTKSLLKQAYEKGFENIEIKNILQDVFFVPETKKIHSLFIEMKNKKTHIAILIDEYGGVSGMVTLEDLLEEIVGNINDEYDLDNEEIRKIGNNKYLVNASISINDLNNYLDLEIESSHYDSLNGIIIEKLGYIPIDLKKNKIDDIVIENIKIKIIKIENKKIDKVILEILKGVNN